MLDGNFSIHVQKQKRTPIIVGQRVAKKDDNNSWKLLKLKEIDTTKPILICLGGNGTLIPKDANFYAKVAQQFLGTQNNYDFIPIISFCYSKYEKTYSKKGSFIDNEIKEIAQQLFAPLISENGVKLELNQAQKNMRNITFLTHCYGASALHKLVLECSKMMERLQYNQNEITQILQNIVHVSYAPDINTSYTKNIFVKSLSDKRFGNAYKQELNRFYLMNDCTIIQENIDKNKQNKANALNNIETNNHQKSTIKNEPYLGQGELILDENCLNLFVGSLINELTSTIDEHSIQIVQRNYKLNEKDDDDKCLWKTIVQRAEGASQCLAQSLILSVLNSIKNSQQAEFEPFYSLDELKEINQNTLDNFNNSFKEQKHYAEYLQMTKN